MENKLETTTLHRVLASFSRGLPERMWTVRGCGFGWALNSSECCISFSDLYGGDSYFGVRSGSDF